MPPSSSPRSSSSSTSRPSSRLYRVWTGHLGGIYGWAARADFIAAFAALLGVLLFDILPGLFIGIAVSLLLLIYRASRPRVSTLVRAPAAGSDDATWVDAATHPDLRARDDIVVVRVESGLFFANADHVRDQIRERITPATIAVILDAETTPAIDVTATDMLATLAAELRRRDISLLVAHGIGQIRQSCGPPAIRTTSCRPSTRPSTPPSPP